VKELLERLAKGLVDDLASVSVTEVEGTEGVELELRVAPDDLGKVIGRQGRTARSLRTILAAAGAKRGRRVVLEIVE
jgi:predicted RNA-binding protein YlqC (UPF0109 family)